MGAQQSVDQPQQLQTIIDDDQQEQTLSVVDPKQLVPVCAALTKAHIEVIATTIPSAKVQEAIIWVRPSAALDALLKSGALGPDVHATAYKKLGLFVSNLDEHTTVLDMLTKCEQMAAEGIDVVACSAATSLAKKQIFHY